MMKERIISIDILRGFAVLGILIMNIVSFSMPMMAYFNPYIHASSVYDHILYCVGHVLADQKFMAIFSMLFGASTILFIESIKKKGKSPLLLFYSRNFWLIVIGVLHSTYIWYGDVLLIYATCSFILYFFKNLQSRTQFILGFVIYFIPSFSNYLMETYLVNHLSIADEKVMMEMYHPTPANINEEIQAMRGTYAQQLEYRSKMFEPNDEHKEGILGGAIIGISFLIDLFARSFGMMLIGMACHHWGVFSNSRSFNFYKNMIKHGFSIGVPIAIIGLFLSYHHVWDWRYMQYLGRLPNQIATPFIAFAYVGLIILLIRKDLLSPMLQRLSFVGKTALTSYLLQSVVATIIFYGFGLGLFGEVDRIGQLIVVFFIWWSLLVGCQWWMQKYKYGPVEWVWRCLTNLNIYQFKK